MIYCTRQSPIRYFVYASQQWKQEEYLKSVQMDSANTFLLLILKSSHSIPCLLIGPRAAAGRVQWNRVCLFFRPSVRAFSWNCIFSFFWNLTWCWKSIWSCAWQSRIFLKKTFLPQKLGKWTKNGSKTGFFEFIERFCH